jgi:hypothetical protein
LRHKHVIRLVAKEQRDVHCLLNPVMLAQSCLDLRMVCHGEWSAVQYGVAQREVGVPQLPFKSFVTFI